MALKHVIQLVLQRGESSGYDITKEFDHMLGYFWSATHQQVYRELAKMVDVGLVSYRVESQEGKPDRKVYQLTESGLDSLKEWLTSPFEPKRAKDEMLVRLLGHSLLGADGLKEMVSSQKAFHQQTLEKYLAIEKEVLAETPVEEMSPEFRIFYLPLRRGIHVEKAWLEWADEVDEAIALYEDAKEAKKPK